MASTQPAEPSAEIRRRVMAARAIQEARYKDEKGSLLQCTDRIASAPQVRVAR